jgi:hypothetical protein
MGDFSAPKLETVRWGAIGVGARGSGAVSQLAQIEGSQIVAIADLYEDWAKNAGKAVEKLGKPAPALYYGTPDKYHEMLARPDIDAVVICTPWEEHAPMANRRNCCSNQPTFLWAKALAASSVPRRGIVTRAMPSERNRRRYRRARGLCTNTSGTKCAPTCNNSCGGAGDGTGLVLKNRLNTGSTRLIT